MAMVVEKVECVELQQREGLRHATQIGGVRVPGNTLDHDYIIKLIYSFYRLLNLFYKI